MKNFKNKRVAMKIFFRWIELKNISTVIFKQFTRDQIDRTTLHKVRYLRRVNKHANVEIKQERVFHSSMIKFQVKMASNMKSIELFVRKEKRIKVVGNIQSTLAKLPRSHLGSLEREVEDPPKRILKFALCNVWQSRSMRQSMGLKSRCQSGPLLIRSPNTHPLSVNEACWLNAFKNDGSIGSAELLLHFH
jgi:hypothetical protein